MLSNKKHHQLVLIGMFSIVTFGCGTSNMTLILHNNSGQQLNEVFVHGNGKKFGFGKILHDGIGGYHNAEQTFGREFPEKLTPEISYFRWEEALTADRIC